MWGEFKPSSGSKLIDFLDKVVDLHSMLYDEPGEYEEPDTMDVGPLIDGMNIRKDFEAAVSHLGLKD